MSPDFVYTVYSIIIIAMSFFVYTHCIQLESRFFRSLVYKVYIFRGGRIA